MKKEIQNRAGRRNLGRDPLDINGGSQFWLSLDRFKDGYARKLAHICKEPFRAIDKCGNHAVRLEIAGTPYRLFPVVHVSKLKFVKMFPERPTIRLSVNEADRVNFDEVLLPEDSWEGDLAEEGFEVEKILDVRSGRKTRYGRVHRQFLVHWKGYDRPSWVDEADCGALLQEFDRNRERKNRYEVMQSHEGEFLIKEVRVMRRVE